MGPAGSVAVPGSSSLQRPVRRDCVGIGSRHPCGPPSSAIPMKIHGLMVEIYKKGRDDRYHSQIMGVTFILGCPYIYYVYILCIYIYMYIYIYIMCIYIYIYYVYIYIHIIYIYIYILSIYILCIYIIL